MQHWDPHDQHALNSELIRSARAGNAADLWQLLTNYEPLIESTVARVVNETRPGTITEAFIGELCRDATVLLCEKFDTFRGENPQFSHWVRTVTRRYALRLLASPRAPARHERSLDGWRLDETAEISPAPSAAQTFEERVEANHRAAMLAALDQCLADLSATDPRNAEILRWFYKDGSTQKEIKERLETSGDYVSVGAVGKRIAAARRTLQLCIRERMRDRG